jgi:hypothetical protein
VLCSDDFIAASTANEQELDVYRTLLDESKKECGSLRAALLRAQRTNRYVPVLDSTYVCVCVGSEFDYCASMLHSDLHSRLDDLNTRVLALENEKRDLASALSTAKQSIKQAQGVSQCRIEAVEAKYTAQRKIVMALEVCCCSITSNANSTLA